MMDIDVKLQVMICTCGPDGLQRVARMTLPHVAGVEYLVSGQSERQEIPDVLRRDDVKIYFTPTKGLSNNRNHALSLVTAPYALVSDDDLEYYADGLQAVIEIFENRPDVDIAIFRFDGEDGKVYPTQEHDMSEPYRLYTVTSFEIAVRVEAVRSARLEFPVLIGLGTRYVICGEEDVFMLQALKRGLSCRFFPITLCRHRGLTTGVRMMNDPGVLRASGVYIYLRFSWSGPLRILLKAWRSGGNLFRNVKYLMQGVLFARKHRKEILGL